MTVRFRDRRHAGRELAVRLQGQPFGRPVVLALPRGGVPVGCELAAALGAPLEVFVARKVGAPGHEEYGLGAIAEGWDGLVISEAATGLGFAPDRVRALARSEQAELDRRVERYRAGRALPDVAGRDVLLVDDGLATGVTAEAAVCALRARGPRRLVLAAPVCSSEAATRLRTLADDVVCLATPADFQAVGAWYEDFAPTTDDEVLECLDRARTAPSSKAVPREGVEPSRRSRGKRV